MIVVYYAKLHSYFLVGGMTWLNDELLMDDGVNLFYTVWYYVTSHFFNLFN